MTNTYKSIISPGDTFLLKSKVTFNDSTDTKSGTFKVTAGTGSYICTGVTTHTYNMELTAGKTYTATVISLSGAEVGISSITITRCF